jgi:hypothetical protein
MVHDVKKTHRLSPQWWENNKRKNQQYQTTDPTRTNAPSTLIRTKNESTALATEQHQGNCGREGPSREKILGEKISRKPKITFIGGTRFFIYRPKFSSILNSVRPNLLICI